ncbi:flagellar hook-basal body complex protein FliE [Caldibacillus debilis]|uniref:Flagellar hook-basal body complex protein FliE n=1 Tax=Caldibacillus debilis TaxID=301148 RepID=A0A150LBP5_9BACI|nr:flagellar hook-basal body complex protein FliE [Caldibacillus debilis]KYD09429.1 hypothetical protein B4135_3753 [Caldibacillus debilis]
MAIESVFLNPATAPVSPAKNLAPSPETQRTEQSFASFLKDAINKVNELQVQSDQMTEKLALGQDVELHQVMIAAEKASIALQATLEIRNKVIEAYQEIMRMQI